MSWTVEQLIEGRRRDWEIHHSIDRDTQLVESIAREILSNIATMRAIQRRPWLLVEACFQIVDKNRDRVPFFFNEVQRDFVDKLDKEGASRPFFILKGRQQGFTSVITAIQLAFAITTRDFAGFTIADTADNTRAIFNDKAKMPYQWLPEVLKPKERFNSINELFFDKLNSSWRVSTATPQVGRSRTLSFVHFSEIAYYQCDLAALQKGIGEAATGNSLRIYETTANGFNQAKTLWDLGFSGQRPPIISLFYEWWRTSEYVSDDLSVLDNLQDDWIASRVQWLTRRGLDKRQIAWYVSKYNGYIEGPETIKQEYPCTAEEAFIASGDCVFGNELVIQQIAACKGLQAAKSGYFEYKRSRPADGDFDEVAITDIQWVDDPNGEITIHKEPERSREIRGGIVQSLKPYAIGGDTAGDGSDYFTAKVIDNITGETVATYRKCKTDDDLYAEQIYCLGRYYNDAIVGIEVNFSAAPTRRLERCGYPNLYFRESVDDITRRPLKKYGFKTTSQSRPVIISGLKRKWRDSAGSIEVDIPTLHEMLTFVNDESGKPQAMVGKHDDLVMALAIAHYVGEQGDHTWQDVEPEQDFISRFFPDVDDDKSESAGDYFGWEDL